MCSKILTLVVLTVFWAFPDAVYTHNSRGNKLYKKGKYSEALIEYSSADSISKDHDARVSSNIGNAYFKLNAYKNSEKFYKKGLNVNNKLERANVFYNLGNAQSRVGDAMLKQNPSEALNRYKEAKKSYINSLKLNPKDLDAKWNLQLTNEKIKQLEKQDKNKQDKNKQDKNKQDKNKQDKNKQDKNKQDKNKQDKNKQDKNKQDKNKQDKNKQDKNKQDKEKNSPIPNSDKKKQNMKKENAMRLLMQYADDDKKLNKPTKEMQKLKNKKIEKDW